MDPKRIQRARRMDLIGRVGITAGGVGIIFSVVGILFLIAKVALPLFFSPSVQLITSLPPLSDQRPVMVGGDEYLDTVYSLYADGRIVFRKAATGQKVETLQLKSPGNTGNKKAKILWVTGGKTYTVLWSDGWVTLEKISFRPQFDAQAKKSIARTLERTGQVPPPAKGTPQLVAVSQGGEEMGLTRAALLKGNTLVITRTIREEDLTGEVEENTQQATLKDPLPGTVSALALGLGGKWLYAGTENGYLVRWDLEDMEKPRLLETQKAFEDGRSLTVLAMSLGDRTLLVGDQKGGITAWFQVTPEGGTPQFLNIHTLVSHNKPITRLFPSPTTRSVASLDTSGEMKFSHITNEKHLFTLDAPAPLAAGGLLSRFNGLVALDTKGTTHLWGMDIPHPEASWKSFFGKMWYESYPSPEYVWQSSSGDDDFEPKLSLIPLVFGTLKATFYGMLFAIPLSVLGAMYTAHLMNPRLRKVVKPAIEIMGSVPSVVVGFLAALWLAPILKGSIVSMLLVLGFLPLVVLGMMALWGWIRELPLAKRIGHGYEFILMGPGLVLAVWVAFMLGRWLEGVLFGGDLPLWLFQEADIHFDQRNSIVIAFGLGFAVVPIIFTIADDALVNVPRRLTAASLALGASRWQTVWRVVLPTASPGIFAAVMIGFGRAVGETMIVLMATGNTPILDMSIFTGMRTLAANIAVEIPEAPVNSTLYRTLFLSAVLLFLTTFLLNSIAEMVRIKLRKKYGQD